MREIIDFDLKQNKKQSKNREQNIYISMCEYL